MPSEILTSIDDLNDKPVVDINNRAYVLPFTAHANISLAERLQSDVKDAKVVKAFNTVSTEVIRMPDSELRQHKVSIFLASDDTGGKNIIADLAHEIGFETVDCGELKSAWMLEATADLLRFLMGFPQKDGRIVLGRYLTISAHVLPQPAEPPII